MRPPLPIKLLLVTAFLSALIANASPTPAPSPALADVLTAPFNGLGTRVSNGVQSLWSGIKGGGSKAADVLSNVRPSCFGRTCGGEALSGAKLPGINGDVLPVRGSKPLERNGEILPVSSTESSGIGDDVSRGADPADYHVEPNEHAGLSQSGPRLTRSPAFREQPGGVRFYISQRLAAARQRLNDVRQKARGGWNSRRGNSATRDAPPPEETLDPDWEAMLSRMQNGEGAPSTVEGIRAGWDKRLRDIASGKPQPAKKKVFTPSDMGTIDEDKPLKDFRTWANAAEKRRKAWMDFQEHARGYAGRAKQGVTTALNRAKQGSATAWNRAATSIRTKWTSAAALFKHGGRPLLARLFRMWMERAGMRFRHLRNTRQPGVMPPAVSPQGLHLPQQPITAHSGVQTPPSQLLEAQEHLGAAERQVDNPNTLTSLEKTPADQRSPDKGAIQSLLTTQSSRSPFKSSRSDYDRYQSIPPDINLYPIDEELSLSSGVLQRVDTTPKNGARNTLSSVRNGAARAGSFVGAGWQRATAFFRAMGKPALSNLIKDFLKNTRLRFGARFRGPGASQGNAGAAGAVDNTGTAGAKGRSLAELFKEDDEAAALAGGKGTPITEFASARPVSPDTPNENVFGRAPSPQDEGRYIAVPFGEGTSGATLSGRSIRDPSDLSDRSTGGSHMGKVPDGNYLTPQKEEDISNFDEHVTEGLPSIETRRPRRKKRGEVRATIVQD